MYYPNFTDPRVRRRCEIAIDFVEQYISNKPKFVSRNQIHKYIGRSNNDLGHYLKTQLLICTNHFYNKDTGVCKQYRKNVDGLAELKRLLFEPTAIIAKQPLEFPKILTEQLQSGEFVYNEKSDRWFNPIQSLRRSDRNQALLKFGYKYDYDIESAAPTLLYQYAQKLQIRQQKQLKLPYIEHYLLNKHAIRDKIAKDCGCSSNDVKKAITALFQGAYLSNNSKTWLFYDLGCNHALINKLKLNEDLCALRKDIKAMWKIIARDLKETKQIKVLRGRDLREFDQIAVCDIKKRFRITGRDKARIYRKLEKEIMEVIWRELRKQKIDHLKIHDGWVSRQMCDVAALCDQVLARTGYRIRISAGIIDANNNSQHTTI